MIPSFGSEPSIHMVYGEIKFWTIWKKLVYHHRTTQLPLPFRLNNDRISLGPADNLGHLSIIRAHLLAQNPLSIWCLEKSKSKAFWRSWYITTEPPNYLYHFPEIMIGKKSAAHLHFAIFGLYELIFWLRTLRPYCYSGNLVSNHFEEVGIWPPNHPTAFTISAK